MATASTDPLERLEALLGLEDAGARPAGGCW